MRANEFDDARIAAVYDIFDADRSDLDVYLALAGEFGAARVLDLGCGTGTLAIMLATRGFEVTASIRRARCSMSLVRSLVPTVSNGFAETGSRCRSNSGSIS